MAMVVAAVPYDRTCNFLACISQKTKYCPRGFFGIIRSDCHLQNVDTLCFDFEQEGRSDLHADYIFMAQVLLHIHDVALVLSRLYDVLNEGGHLLIVDFDKNEEVVSDMVHNGFDQEKLADILIKIGYRDIQSKTFYTGSKIFMGQDASLVILDSQK